MSAERFRVGVAIPAYNEATRLALAIESVRAQTEAPAEILVVDDGSSDETAAVARSLGARVMSQPNAGVARARNRLLAELESPWLAFLDADDVWLPDKLASIRRAHETCPRADFLISDVRCRAQDGALATPSVFAGTAQFAAMPKDLLGSDVVAIDRRDLGRALAVGNFIGTSTVVVNREAALARGCTFAETLPATPDTFVAEDVEWYLRVLRWTDAAAVTRTLSEYRWRTGSLSFDYGRVRYGDVKLGERVAANPSAYVDGAAAAFVAERRAHLRHAARIYAGAGNFSRAAAILSEAQRDRNDPRDAAAIVALAVAKTAAGRSVFDLLRRLRSRARARTQHG